MHRRTLQAVLVAGIGIFALGIAAATLSFAIHAESGFGPNGGGFTEGLGGLGPAPPLEEGPVASGSVPFLQELIGVLIAVSLLVVLVYLIFYSREAVPFFLAAATGFVIFWFLLILLIELFGPVSPPDFDLFSASGLGGPGVAADAGLGSRGIPSITAIVGVLLSLVIVGALFAITRSTGMTDALRRPDRNRESNSAAIGRAAGRAADRLEEGGTFDNEVYRAWTEMTGLLDVESPDTTTPGEFAMTAEEAGMDVADVQSLTGLFEDVRYGAHPATERREQRAIRTFRRIESTYAPEDS